MHLSLGMLFKKGNIRKDPRLGLFYATFAFEGKPWSVAGRDSDVPHKDISEIAFMLS